MIFFYFRVRQAKALALDSSQGSASSPIAMQQSSQWRLPLSKLVKTRRNRSHHGPSFPILCLLSFLLPPFKNLSKKINPIERSAIAPEVRESLSFLAPSRPPFPSRVSATNTCMQGSHLLFLGKIRFSARVDVVANIDYAIPSIHFLILENVSR